MAQESNELTQLYAMMGRQAYYIEILKARVSELEQTISGMEYGPRLESFADLPQEQEKNPDEARPARRRNVNPASPSVGEASSDSKAD